jgi:hypothetical protein
MRFADCMSFCHAYLGDAICRFLTACVLRNQGGHTGRRRVEHHFVLIQLKGLELQLFFFYFFLTLNG